MSMADEFCWINKLVCQVIEISIKGNNRMMDLSSVKNSYRFYAPFYDYIFGRIVNEGRKEAIARFEQNSGDRIMEIGVGTGLSLPFYKRHVEVYGIDVSPEMLERARKRFQGPKFPHVRELREMDAHKLEYPDNYFDGTVAMYVLSVVPDPEAVMQEMFRVTKPGGPILVVNHFSSNHKVLRSFENRLAPFSKKLGFRPDFSMDGLVKTVGRSPERVTRVNFGGYWKVLEFSNNGAVPNEEKSKLMPSK